MVNKCADERAEDGGFGWAKARKKDNIEWHNVISMHMPSRYIHTHSS